MTAIVAHAAVAATYDSTLNPLLALETRLVLPLLPELHGCLAVDVSCGTGRWTRQLLQRGAQTIAIDRCPEMLGRAPGPKALADARRLPLPDRCADLTICAMALSYTGPDLSELARVTRPGGLVLVSDMHPDAMRRGWSRIGADAITYSISELQFPSLRRVRLVEACFDECDLDLYRQAGKPEIIRKVSEVPAIFVAAWVRE